MLAESGLISAKPEQFTHWHNAMDARWLERMHLPASGGLPFDGDFWPSGKIYFQATFLVCPATKFYSADFSGPFEVFGVTDSKKTGQIQPSPTQIPLFLRLSPRGSPRFPETRFRRVTPLPPAPTSPAPRNFRLNISVRSNR
jgi:hypothetical protein